MRVKLRQLGTDPEGVRTHMPACETPEPGSVIRAVKVTRSPGLTDLGDDPKDSTVGGEISDCADDTRTEENARRTHRASPCTSSAWADKSPPARISQHDNSAMII